MRKLERRLAHFLAVHRFAWLGCGVLAAGALATISFASVAIFPEVRPFSLRIAALYGALGLIAFPFFLKALELAGQGRLDQFHRAAWFSWSALLVLLYLAWVLSMVILLHLVWPDPSLSVSG